MYSTYTFLKHASLKKERAIFDQARDLSTSSKRSNTILDVTMHSCGTGWPTFVTIVTHRLADADTTQRPGCGAMPGPG
jgi:hypothetical protein